MGTGKTAVGIRLAEMLDMEFIDTDDIIEEDSKTTIPEIFSKIGEEHFRDLESKAVEKVCKLSRQIISTGGGVVIREQNVQSLRRCCGRGSHFTPEQITELIHLNLRLMRWLIKSQTSSGNIHPKI
jgi:shikimate kinase